jgi:hypothetical protein
VGGLPVGGERRQEACLAGAGGADEGFEFLSAGGDPLEGAGLVGAQALAVDVPDGWAVGVVGEVEEEGFGAEDDGGGEDLTVVDREDAFAICSGDWGRDEVGWSEADRVAFGVFDDGLEHGEPVGGGQDAEQSGLAGGFGEEVPGGAFGLQRQDGGCAEGLDHIPATTWNRIRESFAGKPVVQFTATPFRRDSQRLGGRFIYSFSLQQAQALGIYSTIDYLPITPTTDTDRAVAEAAVARLRNDLDDGFDHLVMARASGIAAANRLHELYAELAPDLNPQLLHSKIGAPARRQARAALDSRAARIVVCVDMLGEGYDLPELKIAVLHDVHRSLGVTLQFIGRFARTSDTVGPACVVAPRRPGRIDETLQQLYREDSDWNQLIRDLSEERIWNRRRSTSSREASPATWPACRYGRRSRR